MGQQVIKKGKKLLKPQAQPEQKGQRMRPSIINGQMPEPLFGNWSFKILQPNDRWQGLTIVEKLKAKHQSPTPPPIMVRAETFSNFHQVFISMCHPFRVKLSFCPWNASTRKQWCVCPRKLEHGHGISLQLGLKFWPILVIVQISPLTKVL